MIKNRMVKDLTVSELQEVITQAFLEAVRRLVLSRAVLIAAVIVAVLIALWLVVSLPAV